MLYKYETHCHTSQVSRCAKSTGAEMARKYKEIGYTGIIVTDHFFNGNCAVPKDLPWKERIDMYYAGYEDAKAEGDKIGLQVFFGLEWTYHGIDFLTFGVGKDFLYAHPEIETMQPAPYIDLVHEAGGFVIHAHPFREAHYIHEFILAPYQEDAVEVYNTSHSEKIIDDRAKWYAKTYNKIFTSGSDAHQTGKISGGGIYFDHKVKDLDEIIELIKTKQIKKLGKRTLKYMDPENKAKYHGKRYVKK